MSFERIYGKKKMGPRHATSQSGNMSVGPRHATSASLGAGRVSKNRYTARDLLAMSKPMTKPANMNMGQAGMITSHRRLANPSEASNRYGPVIGTWGMRVRGANQVSSGGPLP